LQVLAAHPWTAALGLRVGVLNGIVHLAGSAPSEAVWTAAGVIAAQVAGARGVVNRIEAPGAPSPSREVNLDVEDEEREQP
jgi:osmotically-inducible protein OsmY